MIIKPAYRPIGRVWWRFVGFKGPEFVALVRGDDGKLSTAGACIATLPDAISDASITSDVPACHVVHGANVAARRGDFSM